MYAKTNATQIKAQLLKNDTIQITQFYRVNYQLSLVDTLIVYSYGTFLPSLTA